MFSRALSIQAAVVVPRIIRLSLSSLSHQASSYLLHHSSSLDGMTLSRWYSRMPVALAVLSRLEYSGCYSCALSYQAVAFCLESSGFFVSSSSLFILGWGDSFSIVQSCASRIALSIQAATVVP